MDSLPNFLTYGAPLRYYYDYYYYYDDDDYDYDYNYFIVESQV